ncbi:MAG: trypsin-like peptidase domain-containing protein [Chloroflexota bacterium]|nr:trypsin-like peptidase domain-containing protein [Ardenticatenaceae bacterium]
MMRKLVFGQGILLLIVAFVMSGCAGFATGADAEIIPVVGGNTAVSTSPTFTNNPTTPLNPVVSVDGSLVNLLEQEQAFIDVYNRVNPAVVNIAVGGGQGSGFLYDTQGHFVTNNHVVDSGGSIVVTFSDGSQSSARVVGTDPDSDLAVIRVDQLPANVVPVTLADSDALQVGQFVIAIGNPFGLQGSMTTGIVSALGRLLPSSTSNGASYSIPDVIQTDAAINPGNSGGPLLDVQGRVIGVNSAIESPVRASSGVGYAVPSNIVDAVVPQLIASGRVAHPWLGIAGTSMTESIAEAMGLAESQRGVLISSVTAGGPAAAAGLRGGSGSSGLGGDVIVGIDGRSVAEFDDLLGYIVQYTTVGQTIQLDVLRNGTLNTVPLTLQARPSSS